MTFDADSKKFGLLNRPGGVMCIYYGESENLTYEKQEHVIPAGLGGHIKLGKGVVSDQANEYFSPLERDVLEKSFVMVNRVIEGPGKRGKTSEKYATTSAVSLVSQGNEHYLGMMKGTQGYFLSQFLLDENGQLKFIKGTDQANFIDWDMLRNKFLNMGDKYVPVIDARFGEKIFIAYHKDKITIGSATELSAEKISEIKCMLAKRLTLGNSRKMCDDASLELKIEHNFISVCKVVAKTAVNTMAYLLGENFVTSNQEIKNIVHAIFAADDSILALVKVLGEAAYFRKKFYLQPEQSAFLIICANGRLEAYIFFYTHAFQMDLCKISGKEGFSFLIDGIVCDWKNAKCDYRYTDYLKKIGVFSGT